MKKIRGNLPELNANIDSFSSSKPSWVGQTPDEFEKSTGNKLLSYTTGRDNKLNTLGPITYQNKGTFENNPLISGSYNKIIGGGNDAISGLASMFGGRIPSPLEFAAQRQAGESGYSSVEQMQSKRREKDMEDQKRKAYEDAIRSGKKGTFSGVWGSFTI